MMTSQAVSPQHSSAVLPTTRRASDLTEPLLRATVQQLTPWMAHLSGYHLGWWDAEGAPTRTSGGKGIRPALALLGAEAVGASVEAGIPAAVAVELLHNFSLLHDDIMDGDEQRRGRPTVWKLHGVSAAMLVGDALHALAIDTLLAHGGPAAVPATRRLSKAMMELAAGQAQDMQFAQRPWVGPGAVSVEEYRAMAEAKTGSLLACAVAVGALLGGGGPHAVASLAQAACHLGLAFQCVDDVIGIWGSPEVSGKPVFGDLRERKKTLPVVAALRASTPASRQLVELLTHPSPAGGDLQLMAKLIEDAGGRQFAEREAQRELAAARRCLDEVPMRHAVREQFNTLAQSLIHREH